MSFTINARADLTLEVFRRIAWGNENVILSSAVLKKLQTARDDFLDLIDQPNIIIYGVNTGYGQRAKERLDKNARLNQATTHCRHSTSITHMDNEG